jgi:phospholipid/cholesterol/gamma-HCH transport system permease protein
MSLQATRSQSLIRAPGRLANRVIDGLARLGEQLVFMAKSLVDVIPGMRHMGEVARLISEISIGAGALIVGAGTVGVIFFMSFFTGTQVGLEGFKGLQLIGAEAFTGFVSAFANTREITPLIAGVTLAAQVGAGFTAELGAMRVNEEIDALEVMAIRPVPYLVSTRIVAALVAITPLYLISLFASYLATEIVVTRILGLSLGTYSHYFGLFLPPIDILYSLIKAAVFAITVSLIHCYYGFNASGGPAGVGIAVGKAIRSSIVAVNVINLMMSAFMWGVSDTVRIAG